MEIRRDHNNRGTRPSNFEALNAASGIHTEKEAFVSKLGTLSFYYTNCRSLYGKIDMLRVLTASRNTDVILLTETWLSCKTDDRELSLKGYSLLRRDRRIGIHGGVAAFIKSSLSCETLADPMSGEEQLECYHLSYMGSGKPN